MSFFSNCVFDNTLIKSVCRYWNQTVTFGVGKGGGPVEKARAHRMTPITLAKNAIKSYENRKKISVKKSYRLISKLICTFYQRIIINQIAKKIFGQSWKNGLTIFDIFFFGISTSTRTLWPREWGPRLQFFFLFPSI